MVAILTSDTTLLNAKVLFLTGIDCEGFFRFGVC